MAWQRYHPDARHDLRRACVLHHATFEVQLDRVHDIFSLIAARTIAVLHVLADREMHFRFLHMESRLRKQPEITAMVVMKMRNDGVMHRFWINADLLECL